MTPFLHWPLGIIFKIVDPMTVYDRMPSPNLEEPSFSIIAITLRVPMDRVEHNSFVVKRQ
jgi:hypothetical protein